MKFKDYFLKEITTLADKVKAYKDGLNRELFKTTDSVDFIAKQLGWEKRPANVSDAEKKLEIQRRPGQTRERQSKDSYVEGQLKERIVSIGKRDKRARDAKLNEAQKPLTCEVCGFDPLQLDIYNVNDEQAKKFFEVHHKQAIADGPRQTKLDDLMIVCANCHTLEHHK